MATEAGVEVIAITDHDTVDGVSEALEAGKEFGVYVIPGIEMSVEENGVHILGFGIDHKNPELLQYSLEAKKRRVEGAQKMIKNLKEAGFVVEWNDALKEAGGGIVARPHIAKAVLDRRENKEKLGGISSVYEFIDKFLSERSPYYVRRAHISSRAAIDLLHGAGGVAVWSHPAIHFRIAEEGMVDYEALGKFLEELYRWGIDGIEIFTPSHTKEDVEFLLKLAEKYKLLKTAGSDFHEKGRGGKVVRTEKETTVLRSADSIGDYPVYGFSTDGIIDALEEAIENLRLNYAGAANKRSY